MTEQHTSRLNGLLVHGMDRFVAERGTGGRLVTARTTSDILGGVPTDEVDVHLEVVRPGRTTGLLEAVAVSGGRAVLRAPEPGRTTEWLATPVASVGDAPVSEPARFVGPVDTANGIAVRRSPRERVFPNVDLTTHLHRQPAGRWGGWTPPWSSSRTVSA